MKLTPLLLTLALIACYPKGWNPNPLYLAPTGYPFSAGPWLVLVEPGKMAVAIKQDLEAAPQTDWWVVEPNLTPPKVTTVPMVQRDDSIWMAVLVDLPLDVNLAYRVRSEVGDTPDITFKAGVSRGKNFRFAAFGDTRTNHEVHRALIESMALENIDFVIHSGDLVDFGGVEDQWDLFLRIESPVMAHAPLIASVGNHDNSARNYFRSVFLTDQYAGNNRYFCKDWGDVRVVTLDSETEIRAGSDQYAFMERCLGEGAAKNQLMVLSLHYPPYSSGEHGSYIEIQEVLGEIAPRFGVEVILAGHDHNYERTKVIDGVTYLIAASGGAPIRTVSQSSFSAVLRTEPHYVLFDVDNGTLVGRAISLEGNVFDTFVIPPSIAQVPTRHVD